MNSSYSDNANDSFEEGKTEHPPPTPGDIDRKATRTKRSESVIQRRALVYENYNKMSSSFAEPRNQRFSDDSEEEPRPLYTKRPLKMPSEIRDDPNAKMIWWILARLEEMGLEADAYLVKKMINSYPADTSQDFIFEAILQNMFEGDASEDNDRHSEDRLQLATRRIGSEYNPFEEFSSSPQYTCDSCYHRVPMDHTDSKQFGCQHFFCKECILKKFKDRIEAREDIDNFTCPECQAHIRLDKFVNFVPEVDQRDMGDNEIGTCSICFDDIKGTEELLKIFDCQEHFFCYECTLNFLKEAVNNRKVLDLKCPDSTCERHVNDDKMKELVPVYLFNRYMRFKRNAMIERDPNMRWCTRPGCEKIVKGSKANPKAKCECGQLTCVGCGNPWHAKRTCEQALEDEYKMFAKQKDLQFCPECKSRVEKTAGCNHMTCPICTYEWCWLCGGEYSPGHFDTLNPLGCPGLMSGNHVRGKWTKCKILVYRFALSIVFILLAALAPLWIVLGAILLPNILYEPRDYYNTSTIIAIRISLFTIGVVLSPLTITCGAIGAIVPGTCLLGNFLFKKHKERAEAKKRRRELIMNRGVKKVQDQNNLQIEIDEDDLQERMRRDIEDDRPLDAFTVFGVHGNQLSRPLLLEEAQLSQPRGDVSIDIE